MDLKACTPDSSGLMNKNADVMMPFSSNSAWKFSESTSPVVHTSSPSVTGTSVLGIRYADGVMICADMLGSYGSLQKYVCDRIFKINDEIVVGASGDYADFQYLIDIVKKNVIEEECLFDGFSLKPRSLHSWLTRTLYSRRSNMNPLWNTFVVAGMDNKVPFLGYVGMIGTSFESPTVASGLGAYIAQPILRAAYEKNPNMSEKEAKDLLVECVRVLFYRDCRASPRYQIGIVKKDGASVEGPFVVEHSWPTHLNTC